jgi:NADH-ubiquinone oxidoreductase chain 4L
MKLGIIIYMIGIEYIIINKERNILKMIILIEILYLGIIIIIISISINIDDIIGIMIGLYVIIIAGLESAIGLGILIGFYRIRGSISIKK